MYLKKNKKSRNREMEQETRKKAKKKCSHDELVRLTDCCGHTSKYDPGVHNCLTTGHRGSRLLCCILKTLDNKRHHLVPFLRKHASEIPSEKETRQNNLKTVFWTFPHLTFSDSLLLTPSNINMLSHSVTPIAYRSLKTLAHATLP